MPVCKSIEPVVYGVGKGEMVDVFCDVVSNPQSYNFEVRLKLFRIANILLTTEALLPLQWSFNNSADYIRVPPSRVVVVNGTRFGI